jgi:hypothetical protein
MFPLSTRPINSVDIKSTEGNRTEETLHKRKSQSIYTNNRPFVSDIQNEVSYQMIDTLLETEKQRNKVDNWNRLDKTTKIQKLHSFAEKYGREHSLPSKDVRSLKSFFNDALEKKKLQRTKDVIYDKELHEISSLPALHFNVATRAFTLRILDLKRVSTLKSLTPKRVTEEVAFEESTVSASVSVP